MDDFFNLCIYQLLTFWLWTRCSDPPAYMYQSATSGLSHQPLGTAHVSPQLAAIPPSLLTPTAPPRAVGATGAKTMSPTPTTTSAENGGGEGAGGSGYLLSTPATVLPTSVQSVYSSWGPSTNTATTSTAGLSPSYYHLLQQQQQQQQQQQSRLSAVAGLGLYAAPLPTASAQVGAPTSNAASPTLPNNACYVEYFGSNKQVFGVASNCNALAKTAILIVSHTTSFYSQRTGQFRNGVC